VEELRWWLAALVASSDDVIISKTLDGVILTWNPAAQRLFGYSEEEAVGQPITIIIPPELHDEEKEILRRLRAGERIQHHETRRITRDGRYLDVSLTISPIRDAAGAIVGASKILRDIGERKRVQEALRESERLASEERFRLIADSAPVTLWIVDVDKQCTYINQPWIDLTGRPFEAALGEGWADSIHAEDVEGSWKSFSEAFDRREPFQIQYRIQRHDGEYRWITDTGVPRYDEHGSFVGYIGSAVDVTERKLADEALSTVSQRLIEAQEDERARLARDLHDDVNQRLAVLNMRLDALSRAVPDSVTEGRKRIEEARREVVNLVTDVQALSHRLHPPRLDYLGIAGAAEALCDEISTQHRIKVSFAAESVPEHLSKRITLCLYRVLQEALQNAIKHSDTAKVTVRLRGVDDQLELTVDDVGIGFDLETTQGRGLGLTSMSERLKAVDGQLAIRSRPKHGTTIRARVPVRE
jgi:PAS domain S-box-containing protein